MYLQECTVWIFAQVTQGIKKSGFGAFHVYKLEHTHLWQQRKKTQQKHSKKLITKPGNSAIFFINVK